MERLQTSDDRLQTSVQIAETGCRIRRGGLLFSGPHLCALLRPPIPRGSRERLLVAVLAQYPYGGRGPPSPSRLRRARQDGIYGMRRVRALSARSVRSRDDCGARQRETIG